MTRCKSVYVTLSGRTVRCTLEEGHPVSETNNGPGTPMHRNFTPGHKIKWPENASSQMAGASPRIVIVDEVAGPVRPITIPPGARILGIGSPDDPTVDFQSIWVDEVSEANAMLTPPPVPADLCGALSRNTEACVFTPHPKGTPHSWAKK